MTYHSLESRVDSIIGDRVFGIIEKTYGFKGFEKIMDYGYKIEDWADQGFS